MMLGDLKTSSMHLNLRESKGMSSIHNISSPRRSANLEDMASAFQSKKNSLQSSTTNSVMNRTSPNKFPKLDLSPEKLNVTKIP
jgi:hypothetical protein